MFGGRFWWAVCAHPVLGGPLRGGVSLWRLECAVQMKSPMRTENTVLLMQVFFLLVFIMAVAFHIISFIFWFWRSELWVHRGGETDTVREISGRTGGRSDVFFHEVTRGSCAERVSFIVNQGDRRFCDAPLTTLITALRSLPTLRHSVLVPTLRGHSVPSIW